MRLVKHEDGYIYGLFCTERKDPEAPKGDESSAVAQCGIVRTTDLKPGSVYQILKLVRRNNVMLFCILSL